MDTFGKHLMRFAQAVDIVPPTVFSEVLEMVRAYLKERLHIELCELHVPIHVGNELGLRSVWHPDSRDWAQTIRNSEGLYNGQISYAYDIERSIWIVSKSGGELAQANQYENLLDDKLSVNIPGFVPLTHHSIRTSIICMLRHDEHLIGVLNLESAKYLRATDSTKEEIDLISNSIAILYGLHKTNLIQSAHTGRILQVLREFKDLPLIISPSVFIASSAKAEKAVTARITRVLAQYDIEVRFWKADIKPGNILEHSWRDISASNIGICYLSEPSETPHYKFQDNQNVVFEAGMMQALSRSTSNVMTSWIPVREVDSPKLPFDFGGERILSVPRDAAGKLDEEAFSVELEKILDDVGITRRKSS